jgi:hypothetical protein
MKGNQKQELSFIEQSLSSFIKGKVVAVSLEEEVTSEKII